MEKLLLEEINKYRKLMGLSVISPDKVVVLEQDGDDDDENSDEELLDYMLGIVEDETYSKIEKILEKTDKTITEIINSSVLTDDELFVLLELAKIKNLQAYSDIIDNLYDTPQYKKIITDKYDEIINNADIKLKEYKNKRI